MAIAFVNSAKATSGAGSGLSQAVTYSSVPGNFVVVMLAASIGTISSVACKDNNNNSLTAGPVPTRGWMFYGPAVNGATSYTVTWVSTAKSSIIIAEYSGVGKKGAQGTNSATSTTASISVTTTVDGSWIVAPAYTAVLSTFTQQTGNLRNQQTGGSGNNNTLGVVDNTAATAGTSVTCSATLGSTAWGMAGIELIPLAFPPMMNAHRSGVPEAHILANF